VAITSFGIKKIGVKPGRLAFNDDCLEGLKDVYDIDTEDSTSLFVDCRSLQKSNGGNVPFYKYHSGEHENTIDIAVRSPALVELLQDFLPIIMGELENSTSNIHVFMWDEFGHHESVCVARIIATLLRQADLGSVTKIRHTAQASWRCAPTCALCAPRPLTGIKFEALKLVKNLYALYR
jgi:hypothetical protein